MYIKHHRVMWFISNNIRNSYLECLHDGVDDLVISTVNNKNHPKQSNIIEHSEETHKII